MLSRTFAACMCLLFLSVQSGRVQSTQPPPPPVVLPSPSTTPTPQPTGANVGDEDVERVDVDLASILLTAIDKERRFVTTLRQEDLRVTEDGVAQNLSVFQRETDLPLSIALLVDVSASQEGVIEDEKRAARAFLDAVIRPAKDSASLLSFTGITRLELAPTSELGDLRAKVEQLKVVSTSNSPECDEENNELTDEQVLRCKTAVWDSLYLTIERVLSKTPERTRRAVILLSDGDDTTSRKSRDEAVAFAIQHNAVVYSIGIRDETFPHGDLRRSDLRKASEATGGRAFFPRDAAELSAAFSQIDRELRSQYFLAYTPTNRARDARFRRVRVEVINPALKKEKLRLLYRQGYYAKAGK